ncbi:hypothetical protein B0J18DRAFT_84484 [Chaetomium sp. MPI-SDFR-AT-0129]|nr:hypothetical protein B0J18DRAFT_84484 [Chaetomium sp. MPI-SDFR-AT-0129]
MWISLSFVPERGGQKFPGAAGGIRHPCTTMPWTLWPALVVLWGVCWMFILNQADPRHDPSLLPRQPQWEPDLDAYVDFAEIYQTYDSSFLHGSWGADLTTSHAILGELERPSPPIHNSFTGSYQTSDTLTLTSNQDILLPFSASPYVAPASLAINLPQTVPLAAGQVPAPLHTLANEDSNWTSQHLAPVTASALQTDAHHVSQLDRTTIKRVLEGTIRTRASLSAKKASFTCQECGQKFTREDSLSRHEREQNHGKFAGSDQTEFRCPNSQCRRSAMDLAGGCQRQATGSLPTAFAPRSPFTLL